MQWVQSQPEAACQWLQDLPAQDPRRTTFFEAAVRRMVEGKQAEERLTSLPEQDRPAARRLVEKMYLPDEKQAHYLKALR